MPLSLNANLPSHIQCDVAESRFPNYGILRRLYNIVECAFRQKEINHLTGAVNILAYLLRKKRTVVTVPDCGFHLPNESWRKPFYRILFWVLPVKRCGYITVMSEKTKEEVLSWLPCNSERVR